MGPAAGLLERERELAALDSLIDDVGNDAARLVVVEGRAGIGKSRVLAAARERAAERGIRTLSARGTELEQEFAYGAVRQLFEPLRTDPDLWEAALAGVDEPGNSARQMSTRYSWVPVTMARPWSDSTRVAASFSRRICE